MKELTFEYKKIKAICLAALILPTVFFFLGWIRIAFSIPLTVALLAAFFFAVFRDSDDRKIRISPKELTLIILMVTAWCFLTGIGGFTASKTDMFWRNPIYADLILKDWPVRYEGSLEGYGLSYYIGYWLIPGSVAKIFTFMGEDAAWNIGRVALVVWSSALVFLCALLLKSYTGAKGFKPTLIMLLLFIFFSDMDVISMCTQTALNNLPEAFFDQGRQFDTTTNCWVFSSMSAQLAWVFNQSVPAWLATLLFLNERSAKCYALIGLSLMITSPLPLLGIFVFMIAFAVRDLVVKAKAGRLKEGIFSIASLTNILAAVSVFPPVAMYITSNKSSGSMIFGLGYTAIHWKSYLAFLLGCHIITVLVLFRKKRMFESILLLCSFLIIPLVFMGTAAFDIVNYPYDRAAFSDFCMRTSIPAIVILMAMVGKYLFGEYDFRNSIRSKILTLVLILGLLAPSADIVSSIAGAIDPARSFFYPYAKSMMSLEEMEPADIFVVDTDGSIKADESNFVCITEDSSFFKYLAR